ncbi:MAG: protein transfer agent-like [Beijerinckiaceae bacterium]|nr:MAG: protein transfer agent-like [Beijerinckiaceae bacterium]
MRTLPPALAAALDSGVTTLCRCWLLTRKDGFELGITDHDSDLMIGTTLFEANGGFDASAIEAGAGLAPSGGEIKGTLTSDRIVAEDIEAGLYDGAVLRSYLVDWQAPTLDFLVDSATLGEIRRADRHFVAETRSAFQALDQEQGRLYTAACNAELGDARCGVDLSTPPFAITGVVLTTDGRNGLTASAVENAVTGLFSRGIVTFTGGANAGMSVIVKDHRAGGELVFWQGLVRPLAPGDTFSVTAGCDKRFSTCRDRFVNAANFRGFPFIPAPEFVLTYARPGEGRHRGRPLVR